MNNGGPMRKYLAFLSLVWIRHPDAPDGRRIRRRATVCGVRNTPMVEREEHHQVKQNHVEEHKVPDRWGGAAGSSAGV